APELCSPRRMGWLGGCVYDTPGRPGQVALQANGFGWPGTAGDVIAIASGSSELAKAHSTALAGAGGWAMVPRHAQENKETAPGNRGPSGQGYSPWRGASSVHHGRRSSIAISLVEDAVEDRYDTAILMSGDSDLIPAIKATKRLAAPKRVIVAFPPNRHAAE